MASRTKKPVKTTPKAKAKAKPATSARTKAKAPAKSVAKKPVTKKSPAKKSVASKSTTRKTTARKSPAKTSAKARVKPAAKPKPVVRAKTKTRASVKSKAVAKTAAKPKPQVKARTTQKVVKAKKPIASRETLATLRDHVDAVEARLKRANSLTKSSVKAMQTAFTRLNERSGQASVAQEKEIVEYVEALNVHLTGLIDKTREDVAHDLQVVLDDPRTEVISSALTKVNHRITQAENDQAAALTSINEQIANLATVVDRRLRRESEARERTEHMLSSKIETVEKSSAEAVSNIGEKIVTLTEELNNRTDHSIAAFKRELSDSGKDHQKDIENNKQNIEAYKSEVDRRMEALEDDQRNSIPSIERRLVTITSRLESLEADRFNQASAPQVAAPAFEPAPQFDSPSIAAVAAPAMAPDAFAPQPATAYESVSPPAQIMQFESPQPAPMPEMMVTAEPEPVAEAPVLEEKPAESHIPQEYVPQEYVPPAEPVETMAAAPAQEYAAAEYASPEYPSGAYPTPESAAMPTAYTNPAFDPAQPAMQPPMMADPNMPPGQLPPPPFASDIPLMPLPEQTMDEARPGGDILPSKSGGFLQKLKAGASGKALGGSSIKLFAMMTGIAVIGLFAAQKLMSEPQTSNPPTDLPSIAAAAPDTQENTSDPAFASAEPVPPVIESMDVVGDYSDTMQAPEIEPNSNGEPSPARLTLESAAADGDMIAQFQLGLSHLEAGRNAEAVRLIRLSANQGQPAAQYRLAKLYENGIGVEKDLPAAMKLLERSAKAGNRIAMHDLGHYFATGAASEQPEIAKAVTWFQQAAERGVLDSQFNLGVLYQEGSGVPKNLVDSYVWYSVAGAQGDPMAKQRAEVLTRDMTETQLAQAKARVKAFVPARIDDAANGVFGNMPWAKPARTQAARVNADVKKAQELLSGLGYEVGKPDGAMGPKTRNAIITFEKSNGLPETGRISAELMDRLSLAAGV